MQKRHWKRYILTIVLLAWAGIILYLSFQNGTDTASTSQHLTEWLFRLCGIDTNDWNEMMLWDHRLRTAAHVITLYVYGMLGVLLLGMEKTAKKLRTFLFVVSGMGLAFFAEAGKVLIGIPGRHCDMGEMLLNFVGFAAGIVVTYGLRGLYRRLKSFVNCNPDSM